MGLFWFSGTQLERAESSVAFGCFGLSWKVAQVQVSSYSGLSE